MEKKYQNIGKNLDLKNSESDKYLNYNFMNYKLSPLDQKQINFSLINQLLKKIIPLNQEKIILIIWK